MSHAGIKKTVGLTDETNESLAGSDGERADEHSASDAYAERFSGKTGKWFLDVQLEKTLELLRDFSPHTTTILDVGGGHGQLALPLAELGYAVTVLGSSEKAFHQINKRPELKIKKIYADVLARTLPEQSYDVVLCFRILPHTLAWQSLLTELCYLSKQAIIFDYPSAESINSIAPLFFKTKKKLEKNTRPYLTFTAEQIQQELKKQHNIIAAEQKQYALPMALHRALKQPGISRGLEGVCASMGLTKKFGSPIIVKAERGNA